MEQLPHQARSQQDLTTFHHQSLDPNESEAIRLVRIKPELRNGFIDCEMWDATIEADYCTLSYVCGDADNVYPILLNGQLYRIRPNLWEFLECARERFAEKAFWIDALSIHQGDLQERSHQVQMMSKIYTRTQQVHVWLGPDHNNGGYALDRINACYWKTGWPIVEDCLKNVVFWKGFQAIHDAKYWNRAWCLQEFVLPKVGLLLMGKGSVQLQDFDTFIEHCYGAVELIAERQENFRTAFFSVVASRGRDLWLMRKQRMLSGNSLDVPWMPFLEPRACSDIRDRMYSALPFHKWESAFRVDYLLNPFELLLEYHLNGVTQPTIDTANLLHLDPIAIMLYTQSAKEFKSPGYDHRVSLPSGAKSLHLQSAASTAQRARWLQFGESTRAATSSSQRTWQAIGDALPRLFVEATLILNHIDFYMLHCTMMKHTDSEVYLVIATDLDSDQSGKSLADLMLSSVGSLTQRSTCCLVSGQYVTKCYMKPVTVYFALLENPELLFRGSYDEEATIGEYNGRRQRKSYDDTVDFSRTP